MEGSLQVSAKVFGQVLYVREKGQGQLACRHIFRQLRVGGAWEMRADIKQKLFVPFHIVSTSPRFGIVDQPRKGSVFYRAFDSLGG